MDALVTAAKNGDKEAFVQLIRMNKQSLYKAAWVYLRNEQDIADALQNTILSCYEKIQGLREVKYFKTWLMRILMNECYNICRKSEKILPIDQYMEQIEAPQKESRHYGELYEAVQELQEELRSPVVLYYVEDFSCREIAEILGISEGAVQKRLARAREKLKNRLQNKEAAGR